MREERFEQPYGTDFLLRSPSQKYPSTRLKVDRSFVTHIHFNAGNAAIVAAVVGMAKSLGLAEIAKGVETEAQASSLIELGYEESQGYSYRREMPADGIEECFKNANFRSSSPFREALG